MTQTKENKTEINFQPSIKQWKAWQFLEDATTTEILYGGAAGGGKSYLGCVWHIYRRLRYAGSRGLIGRNELKAITESTLITLKDTAKAWGIIEGVDFKYNAISNVILWKNGSKSILKELKYQPSDPDFQSLGSMEYTDAFLDEAGEITEKAHEMVLSRVRYKLIEFGLQQKVLITCNPGPHWIKYRFVEDKEGNPMLLKPNQKFVSALLTDNPNAGFVNLYQNALLGMKSEYDRQRLLYGNWSAEERTGGEFYKDFDVQKHVNNVAHIYNREHKLHITFDFNVVPYAPAGVWQVIGKKAYKIKEFSMESPNNNTRKLCRAILKFFHDHEGGCFIYGDCNGNNRDTRSETTDYAIIMQELAVLNPKKKVDSRNPSVAGRGEFINAIFEKNYADIEIIIDKNCFKSIQDFQNVKEDKEGGKSKKNITDPKTKESYQPFGHHSDADDYFLTKCFEEEYQKYHKKTSSMPTSIPRQPNKNIF